MPKLNTTLLIMLLVSAAMANAGNEDVISIPDHAELEWKPLPPGGAMISYANLMGELTGAQPYSALIKIRKGTHAFAHTHSASISKVVLEGTAFTVVEGTRTEYPTGSFLRIPAGVAHESGCVAASNCLLYVHQPKGYDVEQTSKQP
ncbi:cupin domain-containing protein [Pseudomonas sp. LS.1a]|uniref:cupin domain-containing protein n=1 Tax=Pseudomonas sp. LS.1a TaxID=2920387 RepID=UPI001F133901|nr:cupin domain-containing protein [Pseudomonas sp. LS.1a]UMY60962.1 cupin domain-containing protein [Pseudomonas sp. LS.1a]